MDKYIVERRARVRLDWFKRYEEISEFKRADSQEKREWGEIGQGERI